MIEVIYDSNKMKLISCGDYFIVECEKRKRLYCFFYIPSGLRSAAAV